MMHRSGFTLAELLIALVILGVIATFTIPKVLQSQQESQYNATAKEAIATISEAYQALKTSSGISAATTGMDLTPYLNYVAVDSSNTNPVDNTPGYPTLACDTWWVCFRLHSGGTLVIPPASFNGTGALNALLFAFDPDGKVSSTPVSTSGPGKAVQFFVYYDGRITSRAYIEPNTTNSGWVSLSPAPANEPSWFSWD